MFGTRIATRQLTLLSFSSVFTSNDRYSSLGWLIRTRGRYPFCDHFLFVHKHGTLLRISYTVNRCQTLQVYRFLRNGPSDTFWLSAKGDPSKLGNVSTMFVVYEVPCLVSLLQAFFEKQLTNRYHCCCKRSLKTSSTNRHHLCKLSSKKRTTNWNCPLKKLTNQKHS